MASATPTAGERSIKELLAEIGIEVRPSGNYLNRELWRGGELIGHFTAANAVAAFLSGEAS